MAAIRRAASNLEHEANRPDDVPHSKQPKSRPPTGFCENLTCLLLPFYSGPYSVGMMDIEVPAREPRTFSDIKQNGRHLLELETVLFTVYYPSGFGSGQGKSPEEGRNGVGRRGYQDRESRLRRDTKSLLGFLAGLLLRGLVGSRTVARIGFNC